MLPTWFLSHNTTSRIMQTPWTTTNLLYKLSSIFNDPKFSSLAYFNPFPNSIQAQKIATWQNSFPCHWIFIWCNMVYSMNILFMWPKRFLQVHLFVIHVHELMLLFDCTCLVALFYGWYFDVPNVNQWFSLNVRSHPKFNHFFSFILKASR
jgi:hypothetical protein